MSWREQCSVALVFLGAAMVGVAAIMFTALLASLIAPYPLSAGDPVQPDVADFFGVLVALVLGFVLAASGNLIRGETA